MTVLTLRAAELRAVNLPPDPAWRTAFAAGEIVQFDPCLPPVALPVGFGQHRTAQQLPVLAMVCGYSLRAAAVLIPCRSAEDVFRLHVAASRRLGAVSTTPEN